MESITEKSGSASVFNIIPQNIDIYIKECMHAAHTCRTCADGCAGNASKFSDVINVCLECAKTCESLAKALSLHKQGIKNVRQIQIEATIVSCRTCANRCTQRAREFDCIEVCARSVRRIEEIITTLLPKSRRSTKSKIVTFFKSFAVK